MTVDFGTDLSTPGLLDLDPYFTFVSGPEGLGEGLGRRLVTARGSLEGDSAYGYDVRVHLNDDDPSPSAIGLEVAAELAKDERVESASAVVTFDQLAGTLRIVADVLTAAGPFRLTLDVSAVSVAVLLEAA